MVTSLTLRPLNWQQVDKNVHEAWLGGGYVYLRVEPVHHRNMTAYFYVIRGWGNAISGNAATADDAMRAAERAVNDILERAVREDVKVTWNELASPGSLTSYEARCADGFLYGYVAPYGYSEAARYLMDMRGWGAAMSHSTASLEDAKEVVQNEFRSLVKKLLNEG
jgi:hypothetical protein